jgi:hypothetical protein
MPAASIFSDNNMRYGDKSGAFMLGTLPLSSNYQRVGRLDSRCHALHYGSCTGGLMIQQLDDPLLDRKLVGIIPRRSASTTSILFRTASSELNIRSVVLEE